MRDLEQKTFFAIVFMVIVMVITVAVVLGNRAGAPAQAGSVRDTMPGVEPEEIWNPPWSSGKVFRFEDGLSRCYLFKNSDKGAGISCYPIDR